MSRALPLLLALLFGLAGCSAVAPGDTGSDTRTLTPVDVPEDEAESVPALVRDDASRLVDRHAARLASVPYLVYAFDIRTTGDGQTNHRYSARVAPDGRYEATLANYTGFDETRNRTGLHYYDDGEWVYLHREREVAGETVSEGYHRYDATGLEPFDVDRSRQLRALFAASELRVANSRTDEGHFRLYTPEPFTVRRLPARAGIVHDARIRDFYMTVRPDGVILRYRFSYEGRVDGTEIDGRVEATITNVGSETVEPPHWFETARETTTPPGRENASEAGPTTETAA